MTIRQKILKMVYPLFVFFKSGKGDKRILSNKESVNPPVSFYSLSAQLNNGQELFFEKLRGKKVLIVNTASNCGYTSQYEELQKLYQHSKEDIEIIAFPANDFKEQEKGSDEEIAKFCTTNFNIRFPIAKKSSIRKSSAQNEIFKWLTHEEQNGWNDHQPVWNFSKYLINEEGKLTHYFHPAVSPLGEEMLKAINE
jgi:glutathione peroxidase